MAKASKHSKSSVEKDLSILLASTYALYLKTQNYHWNVVGPMFTTLHTLFETQYTEYAIAIDEIAERLRALDVFAPGSFTAFNKLSEVKEELGQPDAIKMIKNLVADQEKIAHIASRLIDASEDKSDQATADLATRRLDIHQKNAWMLRSHLEE